MRVTLANSPQAAKLETQGGHITVLDVEGDIDAYTAGGFIQARDVAGNAKLRSGGGHVRAARIKAPRNWKPMAETSLSAKRAQW